MKQTKETIKTQENESAMAFYTKNDLLKISVHLQTEFSAETHLAEGQWLKEQLKVVKLRMFQVGTLIPTVSRTEGQYLVPLKTFIKNNSLK
jgi:hypothetical protein